MPSGSASDNDAYTGPEGTITVDEDDGTVRVHDGSTSGGNSLPTLGGNTFSEQQTVDTGTAEPPFVLGTDQQGQKITGLNADQVKGVDPTDASNINSGTLPDGRFDQGLANHIHELSATNTVVVEGDASTYSSRATAVDNAIGEAGTNGNDFVVVPVEFWQNGYAASAVDFTKNGFDGQVIRVGQKNDAIDVIAYGADNNNTNESSVALKEAKKRAESLGKVLRIPQGEYNLTSWTTPAVPTDVLIIEGAGPGITKLNGPGNNTENFIHITTYDFYASGFYVKDFKDVFQLRTDGSNNEKTERIELAGVHVESSRGFYGDIGSAAVGDIGRMIIKNCECSSVQKSILVRSPSWDMVKVSEVEASNNNGPGTRIGIQVGDNDTSGTRRHAIVKDCDLKNMSSSDGTESHAIIVYSLYGKIAHNHIQDFGNKGDSGSEALYTKVSRGSVISNTLENAGHGEASILIKGKERGDTSAPAGWAVKVIGNDVYWSEDNSTLGIQLTRENCIATGNYIESADAGMEGLGEGTVMSNNVLKDIIGSLGLRLGEGDNIIAAHNIIDGIGVDKFGTGLSNVGIAITSRMLPEGVETHKVLHNVIKNVNSTSGNAWGVRIKGDNNNAFDFHAIGNSFDDNLDRHFVERDGVTVQSCRIEDNTVRGNGTLSILGLDRDGLIIGGIAVESANAEEPQLAYEQGDMVNFTDSGDGSGTGIYIKLGSGDWAQIG